jgi:hypothetical protein
MIVSGQTMIGRPATFAYLTDDFIPATPDKADLIKVLFDDAEGGVMFMRARAEMAQDYDPNEPREPAGRPTGGRWTAGHIGGAYLIPALKIEDGKFAIGGPTHANAFRSLSKEEQQEYVNQGKNQDPENFFFLNDKGKYLNRRDAREYAEQNDLLSERGLSVKQPELIAEHLRSEDADPAHTSVMVQSIKEKGGFTYNIATDTSPTSGYAVSPYKDRETVIPLANINAKRLVNYIMTNRDLLEKEDHNLGGWVDEGKVYLDISVVAKTPEAAEAICRERNQLAYFDLANLTTVHVGQEHERKNETASDSYQGSGRNVDPAVLRESDRARADRGGAEGASFGMQERRPAGNWKENRAAARHGVWRE